MNYTHRIFTIYRKELIDILRDRRTLIAMILVPILLYPLLLIGSVQAVSYQADTRQNEVLVFGVINQTQKILLESLIASDASFVAAAQQDDNVRSAQTENQSALRKLIERGALGPFLREDDAQARPIQECRVDVYSDRDTLTHAVRQRAIHVGVEFERDYLIDEHGAMNRIMFFTDLEDYRSRDAFTRLRDMFARVREREKESRLSSLGLPKTLVDPFVIEPVDLSAPPSILGQVLPLILVLMTITGAIYPAIDLTAGERERGTLESLMVCPVPVMDLILGKFLVITSVAIMGAALNLASVSLTVYFGGFKQFIASAGGGIPFVQMGIILLCLIPFAMLMSAIMIAVCSYARTFKEAQNYVTPVIIAVLLPGGIAAMPTTRLEGPMQVMPVGNMVLLARDMLVGAPVSGWQIAIVLLSTTLYAAAAVGLAAQVFGTEAVVFSDSGSLKHMFSRRLMKPRRVASPAMALTIVALLFPTWFFVQSAITPKHSGDTMILLRMTAILMPILFVLFPVAVLAYWKVNLVEGLALRSPSARYVLASILLGISAWIPAQELHVIQSYVLPLPDYMIKNLVQFEEAITSLRPLAAIVILAVLPAICEELLFRGVLLNGLSAAARPWVAIVVSAATFGVFHFLLFKFLSTFMLGIVLAYLCIRSRSIMPGMIMHLLHNGLSVASLFVPWREAIGVPDGDTLSHLPASVLIGGVGVFIIGLWLAAGNRGVARAVADRRGTLRSAAEVDVSTSL